MRPVTGSKRSMPRPVPTYNRPRVSSTTAEASLLDSPSSVVYSRNVGAESAGSSTAVASKRAAPPCSATFSSASGSDANRRRSNHS